MKVHNDEGIANHIGPESCGRRREASVEALTGERTGQPLSHERDEDLGADAVSGAEGDTEGRVFASACPARRGRRTWHVRTLHDRELGDLRGGPSRSQNAMAKVRIGKARSRSR